MSGAAGSRSPVKTGGPHNTSWDRSSLGLRDPSDPAHPSWVPGSPGTVVREPAAAGSLPPGALPPPVPGSPASQGDRFAGTNPKGHSSGKTTQNCSDSLAERRDLANMDPETPNMTHKDLPGPEWTPPAVNNGPFRPKDAKVRVLGIPGHPGTLSGMPRNPPRPPRIHPGRHVTRADTPPRYPAACASPWGSDPSDSRALRQAETSILRVP